MEDNQTVELTVYGQFEADLKAFEVLDSELKFDVDTPDGEADCRAYHRKLRKVYNGVDKLRIKAGAEALQKQRDVNTEAKKIFARIDAMANPRKVLLDAKEAEEQAKIDAVAAANKLKAEIEESEREAYLEKGERELAAKAKELQDKADELKAGEDKLANEKRVAEAAKQATIDAEAKAEQDAKDASDKAEREQKEAVAKVEQDAKDAADKIEADRVKAEKEKKAEYARLEKIEADRVANEEHREDVEFAIYTALIPLAGSKANAVNIIDAINKGEVPNISIQY